MAEALKVAATEKVQIRTYDLIFELGDSIDKMIAGLTKPVFEEIVQGASCVRGERLLSGVSDDEDESGAGILQGGHDHVLFAADLVVKAFEARFQEVSDALLDFADVNAAIA